MSKETYDWLNTQVLIGMTAERGFAWHHKQSAQGVEPNHYPGPIPIEDVQRRLFDWNPVKMPIYIQVPCAADEATGIDAEGNPFRTVQVEDRCAVAPDDDPTCVLGVFKSTYQPHPYSPWLLDNVGAILDSELVISSAGLLRKRGVAWVEVSVPKTITTPEGVEFRPNFLAATSLDGTLSTTFARTITNTRCDNTMGAALLEKGQKIKIRHSKYSNLKIVQAREALEIVFEMADDFAVQVAELCNTTVSEGDWAKFLDELTPLPVEDGRGKTVALKKREELNQLWDHDSRVNPWKGTAYGAVQAVNTHAHHVVPTRGDTSRVERNQFAAITGAFDTLDQGTLDKLTAVL